MKYFFLLISFSLIFIGCSSRKKVSYKYKKKYTKSVKLKKHKNSNIKIPKNANYKTKALYKEYEKWLGTKYKLGGQTLNGIDCSSFIQQVYYDAFRLRIPRTTKEQAKVGREIKRMELQAGDMIFFKTGWNVRHVGIIIENGKFIHVSTKRGVSKSSIYNPYWRSKYWQSRRILP